MKNKIYDKWGNLRASLDTMEPALIAAAVRDFLKAGYTFSGYVQEDGLKAANVYTKRRESGDIIIVDIFGETRHVYNRETGMEIPFEPENVSIKNMMDSIYAYNRY